MARITRASLIAWAALCAGFVGCSSEPPRSLLLVTLDTTRADHLSAYGYGRETSPRLDALVAESARFTRAWSTTSWTLPSHASLFTGLYPAAHGAHHDDSGTEALGEHRVGALHEDFVTLAEILRERGYHTAAFIGGPWLKPVYGLMQGFDHVQDEVRGLTGPSARTLTDRAIEWLEAGEPAAPYFLFVNYFDAHWPYDPPRNGRGFGRWREPEPRDWIDRAIGEGVPLSASDRQILIDRYDSEILAMDAQLGRLLDAVDGDSGRPPPMVIITADHGEAFGEGGRYLHNYWISEEMTRIPLIVRFPDGGRAGEVDDRTIQLVDLFPMALRALGIDVPPIPARSRQPDGQPGRAFLELYRSRGTVTRFGPRFDRHLSAVVEWPYKLEVAEPGTPTLYRLDEVSETPLAGPAAEAAGLLSALVEHREAVGQAPVHAASPDPELRDALRAIGYLDGPAGITGELQRGSRE